MEALTFAEQIVVMTRGRAVQMGSADALFERPQHMFVGNFIGSPGMNFLPAQLAGSVLALAGQDLTLDAALATRMPQQAAKFTLGVRPEYVELVGSNSNGALRTTVAKVQDVGTYWLITARVGEVLVRVRLDAQDEPPREGDEVWLKVLGPHSCFYGADEHLLDVQQPDAENAETSANNEETPA